MTRKLKRRSKAVTPVLAAVNETPPAVDVGAWFPLAASVPAKAAFTINETKVVSHSRQPKPEQRQGAYTEERIALLTETELSAALADAKRRGRLAWLCWFVEMRVPGHLVDRRTPLITAALHPGGTLPILPVGDPLLSRPLIEILLVCFQEYNRGSGIEFGLNVADRATFDGYGAYVWGEEIDAICEVCGAVFRHTAFVTVCEDCCCRQPATERPDPYTARWRFATKQAAVCLVAGGWRPSPTAP